MAVISVRLNEEEEKIVNYLSEYYERDRSSLIKQSLIELYEDIIDKEVITDFEESESTAGNAPKFYTAEEVLKE